MNQELFELCASVYKFTGWKTGRHIWSPKRPLVCKGDDFMDGMSFPLYTSDYLLEKLPKRIEGNVLGVGYAIYEPPSAIDIHHAWLASYEDRQGIPHFTLILTPLSKLS